MIRKPPYQTVLSILKEIPTDGHSPLLVVADDYEKYIIKSTKDRIPCYDIINEFLCSLLLQRWKIPTPEIAVIYLDPSLILPESYSQAHKPHFYRNLTFASKLVEPCLDLQKWLNADGKVMQRKFANPIDLLRIGLFDIWVENTDRKPTNNNILLCESDSHFIINAIDHAYTFDSVSYKDLNPEFIVNTFNDSIFDTELARDILSPYRGSRALSELVEKLQQNFYLCIRTCEQNFDTIVQYVPPELSFNEELAKYIHDFLFKKERNKMVFHEFITRIQ